MHKIESAIVRDHFEYFVIILDIVLRCLKLAKQKYEFNTAQRMRTEVKSVYFLNVLPLCFVITLFC